MGKRRCEMTPEQLEKAKAADKRRKQDPEYHKKYYEANKDKINARKKQWKEDNKDRVKQNSKRYREETIEERAKWREENKDLLLLLQMKQRAKKKGLDFNLELEDIQFPSHCPVLGIPLFRSEGKPTHNSPSVDRKDNSKGYVKGNITVMSHLANSMKRDATPEQLVAFAKWVLEEYKV